jgi:hypothetical protein
MSTARRTRKAPAPRKGVGADLADRLDTAARTARRHALDRPADDAAALIADALERLAQLVVWTGGRTAAEHLDRLEVWEEQIRGKAWEEGYAAAEARAAETRTFGPGGRPIGLDPPPFVGPIETD